MLDQCGRAGGDVGKVERYPRGDVRVKSKSGGIKQTGGKKAEGNIQREIFLEGGWGVS